MKAVLDTNVFVAAFVSDRLCRRLLLRARDRDFSLAISPFIRDEFARALSRKAGAAAGEIREAHRTFLSRPERRPAPRSPLGGHWLVMEAILRAGRRLVKALASKNGAVDA